MNGWKFFSPREENEPKHAVIEESERTVWFTWTPPDDRIAYTDTASSFLDTVIAVYTEDKLNNLKPVVQDASGPRLIRGAPSLNPYCAFISFRKAFSTSTVLPSLLKEDLFGKC